MSEYEKAKRAAMDAGIPESELTAAIIKQFGWTPDDPTAGLPPVTVAVTKAEMKDDFAALLAEAKANNVAANVISLITKVALKVVAL